MIPITTSTTRVGRVLQRIPRNDRAADAAEDDEDAEGEGAGVRVINKTIACAGYKEIERKCCGMFGRASARLDPATPTG
jgi:hypothetical protein